MLNLNSLLVKRQIDNPSPGSLDAQCILWKYCYNYVPKFSDRCNKAKSVDPDQTAPVCSSLIRVCTFCNSISTFFSQMLNCTVKRFFFYFLVYGSSDPNFCILEKKNILFLTFLIFSDVKKLQDLKEFFFKYSKKIKIV